MFTCWWIWVPLFFSPRFPSSGRFPPDRGRQCIGMNGSKSGFCFGNTISRSRSRDLKLWISIGTWLQVDQATVEDKSIWFADQGKITRQKILDQCQCTNILVTSGQNQCQSCPQKIFARANTVRDELVPRLGIEAQPARRDGGDADPFNAFFF